MSEHPPYESSPAAATVTAPTRIWSALDAADLTPFALWILTILLSALGYGSSLQSTVIDVLLVAGLITVGIPHGAVDHLLDSGMWHMRRTPLFIVKYLLKAAVMVGVWIVLPQPALLFFLLYSAVHFGEADGKQWGFSMTESVLWGCSLMLFILGTHSGETTNIIRTMGTQVAFPALPFYALLPWLGWAVVRRSTTLAITVMWLSAATMLPLLAVFGMYFIGQHSFTGWMHICAKLERPQWKVWLHALPFNIGAWLLLGIFLQLWPHASLSIDAARGAFFIFVGCLSFPHVIEMHGMYRKFRRVAPHDEPQRE
ncbi:MAG: Brp/Blh family beta-carotene 15,15'-dioxygenase [Candidatus Kapaibacterium sp.]